MNRINDEQLGNLCIIDVNGHSDVEIHVKVRWRCAQSSTLQLEYITLCSGGHCFENVPQSLLTVLDKVKEMSLIKEAEEIFHDTLSEEQFQHIESTKDSHEEEDPSSSQAASLRRSSRLKAVSKLFKNYVT